MKALALPLIVARLSTAMLHVTQPKSPEPADVSTDWIVAPSGNPAFVFAHQDDETTMAGLIRRIVGVNARGQFIWWTNGDGLAPAAGEDPEQYAEKRVAEANEALTRLGVSLDRKTDLLSSEIENYKRLTHVAKGGWYASEAIRYFQAEARRLERALRLANPDRVFVLAWQGGNPEHDLTHIMVARAVRRLREESRQPIPIVQVPAYEYVIACPLRFKPWFHGDVRTIHLSDYEVEQKQWVMDAYRSQQRLMRNFRLVISFLGNLNALRGPRLTAETYVATEQFGVVPPSFDYTKSSHRIELLNYMLDDYLGTPMRFYSMVAPVARALLGA